MRGRNYKYPFNVTRKICNAIPVAGCETLRFSHFLDTWLTDGGEVLRFTH
jgi:hypothetical protein